jgi:hypothetical protein
VAELSEDRIAKALEAHDDPDHLYGRWYCQCGTRLRFGLEELPKHREAVVEKLKEEAAHG